MHPFKKSIVDDGKEYAQAARDMVVLSNRIASAAGLSRSDLDAAVKHGRVFEAGRYIVEARHSCLPQGWMNVLMVTPRSVGSGVGWSNSTHNSFPDGWTYYPKGTGTVVCPEQPSGVDDILEAVKSA